MLTGKQKAQLRSMAMIMPSIFQVGKLGVSASLIHTVSNALKAHELIKINLLKTCPSDTKDVASKLVSSTGSELVQIVGKTIVLYKRNKKAPHIELVK